MSKRAYRATWVNDVNWDQLAQGKEGLDITLGVDVGKYSLWAVCRWVDGRFERPRGFAERLRGVRPSYQLTDN